MSKAEEYLKTYDCNLETITLYGEKLSEILEAYHESRVNAISDKAKEEFFKRLDNMNQNEFDSYSLTDHIENFTTLLKNKLLKK